MEDVVSTGDYDWQATDETFENNVLIRVRVTRGPCIYAVFDNGEKVSGDHGPLNDAECISFAEGYAAGKNNNG